MAVEQFTAALQSQVYKNWLKQSGKNVINNTVKELRASQQTSAKTSFYLTKSTVKDLFKTIANIDLPDSQAQEFLNLMLTGSADGRVGPEGLAKGEKFTKVAGEDAIFFQNIGFDTITVRLNQVMQQYPKLQAVMELAEENYYVAEVAALNKQIDLTAAEKRDRLTKIEQAAAERASLGYYFNKGHVIGVATNVTKQFRDKLAKTDQLAKNQRDVLINVLDLYIDKMVQDDLASANLPSAVTQELYASYIKSSDKYLVELQHRVTNQGTTAAASRSITLELSKIFGVTPKDLLKTVTSSPTVAATLLKTEGSPSFVTILAKQLADTMAGKPKNKAVYNIKPTLVGEKTTKITKPKSHKQDIQKLKKLKQELEKVKPDPSSIKVAVDVPESLNLFSLQTIINSQLQETIRKNMGTGRSSNVLNYRSGRFAASVQVERLTQSRQGMITVFYSYMKNPYQTFEPGFAQGSPESRSPKLLISKSIREVAAAQVTSQLRAVSV
jgi:hypothetical protein